jgi:carbon storage regulator
MLVLSRRINESIQIGEGITVSVLRIDGERVRIGIDAPIEVRVIRSELMAEVATENLRAAKMPKPSLDLESWTHRSGRTTPSGKRLP